MEFESLYSNDEPLIHSFIELKMIPKIHLFYWWKFYINIFAWRLLSILAIMQYCSQYSYFHHYFGMILDLYFLLLFHFQKRNCLVFSSSVFADSYGCKWCILELRQEESVKMMTALYGTDHFTVDNLLLCSLCLCVEDASFLPIQNNN